MALLRLASRVGSAPCRRLPSTAATNLHGKRMDGLRVPVRMGGTTQCPFARLWMGDLQPHHHEHIPEEQRPVSKTFTPRPHQSVPPHEWKHFDALLSACEEGTVQPPAVQERYQHLKGIGFLPNQEVFLRMVNAYALHHEFQAEEQQVLEEAAAAGCSIAVQQ